MDGGTSSKQLPARESTFRRCSDPMVLGTLSSKLPCSHKPCNTKSPLYEGAAGGTVERGKDGPLHAYRTFTSSSARWPSSSGNLVSKLPESCSFCRLVSLLMAGGSCVIRLPASDSSCVTCECSVVALHGFLDRLCHRQQHLEACYVEDLRRHFLQIELAEVQRTSVACVHTFVRASDAVFRPQTRVIAPMLHRTPAMLILTSMRRSTAARTCRTILCFLLVVCGGLRSNGALCRRLAPAPCHP